KIGKAESEKSCTRGIKPEGARELGLLVMRSRLLDVAGEAVAHRNDRDTQHGEHGRDSQPTIGCAIIAMARQHVRRDQRSDDRARLIERFLQTESPTLANVIAGAALH